MEQMYSRQASILHSYTTLFHGNHVDHLTAAAQQLPLCASVGLVLAILGPPSAHCSYHDAVHVEPGLTQWRCIGLAETALQHVEKGLTHHLKTSKQTSTQTQKEKFIWTPSHMEQLFESCIRRCWSYSKRLCLDSHCLMLSPKVDQKFFQGVKIVQVADCCINHKHHLGAQIVAKTVFKSVRIHSFKYMSILSGHCGQRSSPWWHGPGTQGWRGSLVWNRSLYCSGKDWAVQGPAQTV